METRTHDPHHLLPGGGCGWVKDHPQSERGALPAEATLPHSTPSRAHSHTHTRADTPTHTHSPTFTHPHSYMQPHAHMHSHASTHSCTLTLTHISRLSHLHTESPMSLEKMVSLISTPHGWELTHFSYVYKAYELSQGNDPDVENRPKGTRSSRPRFLTAPPWRVWAEHGFLSCVSPGWGWSGHLSCLANWYWSLQKASSGMVQPGG